MIPKMYSSLAASGSCEAAAVRNGLYLSSRLQMMRKLQRIGFPKSPARSSSQMVHAMEGGTSYDYDLFTIGAGSGGVRASRFASSYGAKVAVCELPFDFISSDLKGGVGGTCVLRGCVPKKLMVYASEFATSFKDSVGFGWEERPLPPHNWNKFMEAKRKELMRLNGAYKNTLKNANVTLIEGRGKLVDSHTVEVDDQRYKARHILIAVGGKAQKLEIPGADLCITSDEVLELPQLPKTVTVIGAGYIAVEFASVFKRMGATVHLVYRGSLPLRGFDEEVRSFAAEQYSVAGLDLHPNSTPVEVQRQDDGKLRTLVKGQDGTVSSIDGSDVVVMATGRVPRTSGLGLEEVGVKLGSHGEIVVDEFLRTSVPSVYALGDAIGRIALTPVALMEGGALARTIAQNTPTAPDYHAVPSAVFSYPEISSVGLTEDKAVKRYGNVDIYTTAFRPMRNTLSGSPHRMFMKVVVDAASGAVVGMHVVGDHAAEMMQGFALAVKLGVTKTQLDSVVGIHPSAAEELVTLRTVTRQIRKST